MCVCQLHAGLEYGPNIQDIQVAVSKYLGLVTLRLADSIVLPLNTTHYSLELGSYLDKYVLLYNCYIDAHQWLPFQSRGSCS